MTIMQNATKILLLLLIGFSSFYFSAKVSSEAIFIEQETNYNDKLTIDFIQLKGQIKIEGWEKEKILIQGKIDIDDTNPVFLKRVGSGYALAFKNERVMSDNEKIKTNLIIKVPYKYSILFNTQTELEMKNIEGDFEINVSNMDAHLTNLNGHSDISVTNGELDISNSFLNGNIKNVNGKITTINTDLIGTVNLTNTKAILSRAPHGLEIHCVNGEITIDSAHKFIRASSTNANLTIKRLDGHLQFNAMNGSVKAKMVCENNDLNRNIDVEILGGSAELNIPENYNMDFNIKTTDKKGNGRKTSVIESEFEEINILKKSHQQNVYEIIGIGSIGNGKNKGLINISDGSVHIIKSKP
jgi:hypothetical protein